MVKDSVPWGVYFFPNNHWWLNHSGSVPLRWQREAPLQSCDEEMIESVPLIECWHLLWGEINHALETSTAPLMTCTLTSYTLLSSHVDTKWVLPTSTAHGFSSYPNDNNSGTWPPFCGTWRYWRYLLISGWSSLFWEFSWLGERVCISFRAVIFELCF